MQQIISIFLSLMMTFMTMLSTFITNFTSNKKVDLSWPVGSESTILAGYEAGKHNGIDIALTSGETEGAPVLAAGDGRVDAVVNGDATYGNYIIITHTKVQTIYAYCKTINVANGAEVTKGQTIGTIGKSPATGKACLFFAVQEKQDDGTYRAVNPATYVANPYGQTPTPENPPQTGSTKGKFVFNVYGYGHGVGMSQIGAIAMANSGKKYDEILRHYYPGISVIVDSSTPATVTKGGVQISLLEYLCKVVKQEIGSNSPIEALKAQAVAAYSFSQANNTYEGQAYDSSFRYSGSDVEKAVMAVLNMTSKSDTPKAMCCYYSGKPANTVYFASSAGKTTSAESVWGGYIPYLNGGVSSPEQVPESQKTYTSEEMRALIQSWAASKGKSVTLGSDPSTWLVIKSHDSARGANCGYVTKISVGGVEIMGASFRSAVLNNGIRSHCFTITYIPD
jgi:peptidoglycan hydrolase-like amidase